MRTKFIIILLVSILCLCFGCRKNSSPEAGALSRTDTLSGIHQDSIHFQQGLKFWEDEKSDLAIECFLKSAESENVTIRMNSYFYLNNIEVNRENYEQSLVYLEKYHDAAHIIYMQVIESERMARRQSAFYRFALGFLCVAGLIAVSLFYSQYKKRKLLSESESKDPETVNYNSCLLQAGLFKQAPIYAEIIELEQKRQTTPKVLNYEKQALLNEYLTTFFSEFIADLTSLKINLTRNDIKLCCLSLLPLSSYAKAICFGSTETSIVKQRKHYIKKKMTRDSDHAPLFDFIFSSRK